MLAHGKQYLDGFHVFQDLGDQQDTGEQDRLAGALLKELATACRKAQWGYLLQQRFPSVKFLVG